MMGVLNWVFLLKSPLVEGMSGVGDTSTVRSVIVADDEDKMQNCSRCLALIISGASNRDRHVPR
jgi:hypothetical protein